MTQRQQVNKELPPPSGMGINGEPLTEIDLIVRAIDKLGGEGAESAVAVIEKLVVMKRDQERWDAEKEFYAKLSEFQNECPQIKKTKSSKQATKEGGSFGYMYAPLDEVERTVRPFLYPRGFAYYWTGRVYAEGNRLLREETCSLLHKNGHKICSVSTVPIEGDVGKMNDIQKFGTGSTYAKRYSLLSVLGLPTTEEDTDGQPPSEKITAEQLENINKAIEASIPPSAVPRFLKLFKIEKLEQMNQDDYEFGLKKLTEFKKKYEAGK